MNGSIHPGRLALVAVAVCASTLAVFAVPPASIKSMPFAKKSGSGERMTFTAIPASASGLVVENPYDDPAMWGPRYTEFQTGSIGTGIAVADVDGDGLVDIYVVNKTRANKLFRQKAPFVFEDITDAGGVGGPTGAWKTGATFADVDNDGDLDLYVCRFNAVNLLYLNDGHGHFTEAAHKAGIDLVSGSVVGAFEDYDRDGYLDLFVVTNVQDFKRAPDGEPDYLYHNRGDGTFEEVTVKAGIAKDPGHGHSATWFDENNDGWPDLYIANDFAQPDHLYRNNGDGTFTEALSVAVPHTTWFSMGSDSADINNDGLADLLVAEMAATTHYKSKVAMGDMGGIVNDMDAMVTPQYMKNAVFLNSGADRFFEVAKITGLGSTDWSWSTRFEDLDNDGWVDLHVTNGMVRPFIDSDLLNITKKLTSQEEIIAAVKSRPPQRETNLAFRNDHNLRFVKVQKDWGLDHTGVSFGSAFADLDNDGDLDLVYTNYEDTISVYRNDCPAGNSIILELKGTTSNRHGVGAQAIVRTSEGLQTRRLTVARGALSSSEPIMHFGLGKLERVAELEIRWPSGQVQKFQDLAANTKYVVTEPAGKTKTQPAVASRLLNDGLFQERTAKIGLDFVNRERVFDDMVRQSLLPNRMNTLGGGVAWADANGDGLIDLYFAGAAGNPGALYLGSRKGVFTRSSVPQPWDAHPEVEGMAPVWLDVDSDGDLDLLVTSGSVEVDKGNDALRSRLYLNNGKGVFTEADSTKIKLPAFSAAAVCVADFDRDGDLDVFIGGRVVPGEYPTAPLSVLLENRAGLLVDVTDEICPELRKCGMVTSALWTDVDRDGWVDLLVVGEWMTPRLFHNSTKQSFNEVTAEAGFNQGSGWWNSLTAADVNGDGYTDYIAGNVGLNTKYSANREHPVRLYYADFENSGKYEIVEAKYEGDKLYPVRGRSCSSRAMPTLKEKFPTFHDFGSALLPEIYTPEKLSTALQLTVDELASGIFLNDGHGHFSFQPLPRLAQTAPIFGMGAVDFNGDGNVDLVVAQNFNGPQVETGHFDGGLSMLLLGDGKGAFSVATPAESGIAISGEARGVALADWNQDGWADVIMTRINQSVLAYTNRGTPNGHSFTVKLSGSVGNPDCLGARVTVHYKNKNVQTAELYSTSGYLSQSEPLVFFGYATGNPPESIDVIWPDGARSSHPFPADKTKVILGKTK